MILLAACLSMPLFATDGPVCPPERQGVACECSEPITVEVGEGVGWIEVERQTVSVGTWSRQGMLWGFEVCDDDTELCEWIEPSAEWLPPRDYSMPHEDVLYRYRFRACDGSGCQAWTNEVEYRGAPYACYATPPGREVQCYVGAGLVSR